MVPLVNDISLVSMVKDTDGPTVWSDGPTNKYDSGATCQGLFCTPKSGVAYICPKNTKVPPVKLAQQGRYVHTAIEYNCFGRLVVTVVVKLGKT